MSFRRVRLCTAREARERERERERGREREGERGREREREGVPSAVNLFTGGQLLHTVCARAQPVLVAGGALQRSNRPRTSVAQRHAFFVATAPRAHKKSLPTARRTFHRQFFLQFLNRHRIHNAAAALIKRQSKEVKKACRKDSFPERRSRPAPCEWKGWDAWCTT